MEEVEVIKAEREVTEKEIRDATFDMCKYIQHLVRSFIILKNYNGFPDINIIFLDLLGNHVFYYVHNQL